MTTTKQSVDGEGGVCLREEVQKFLYAEAELLDKWSLEEWLALFCDDCEYLVPSLDLEQGEGADVALFLVADDHQRLASRVHQLLGRSAWVENPRSRTRRLVTNVQAVEEDGIIRASANFAVWRFRGDVRDTFVGSYEFVLVRATDSSFRIQRRVATLDSEYLRPEGKLSIIL